MEWADSVYYASNVLITHSLSMTWHYEHLKPPHVPVSERFRSDGLFIG